jgi:hypothetical protein
MVWRGKGCDYVGSQVFEMSKGQSALSRAAAALTRGGASAAVFTYPRGFGGTAAGLGGRHLPVRVHSNRP